MNFKKILIFRIGHLGDTLVALPSLWAIRKTFPKAHLALLSNADKRNPHYISPDQVLPRQGLIDEWITYPTNLGTIATFFALLKLIIALKLGRFDAVVYLMPRARTIQQTERDIRFFRICGISKIIGANYLKQTSLPTTIPRPTPVVEAEWSHLLKCLSFDGLPVDESDVEPNLLLNEAEIASANSWFENVVSGGTNKLRLIAIAPGSKWESKIWAEDRFAEVVKQLILEHKVFPIIFGSHVDRTKGDRLIAHWGIGANAAGNLSVRESAALLAQCKLYLGNDTGTMHLAASVGVPCVAIFASLDWKGKWLPYGDRNHVFRQTVECEGCHTPNCFNDHKCLNLTEADEVYEACSQFLKSV